MHRRRYLLAATAAGLAGLAGCLDGIVSGGDSEPESNPDGTPTSTPEETPSEGEDELGELKSVEGPPIEVTDARVVQHPEPLELSVEIIDPVLTAESVPVLEITLTNPTDEEEGYSLPGGMQGVWRSDDVEPERHFTIKHIDAADTLLAAETDTDCLAIQVDSHPLTEHPHWIEAGETITEEKGVLPVAAGFDGGCPAAGTYRFTARLRETPAQIELTVEDTN